MLAASGREFYDWSGAYRVFTQERMDKDALFAPVIQEVLGYIPPEEPLVAMIDDTLIRKRGRKVAGTSWKRDPLGPAFHTNFVWGQRYIQMSLALPEHPGASRAVCVPYDFTHAPSVKKPKKDASAEDIKRYKAAKKETALPNLALRQLDNLHKAAGGRQVICSVDGSYTNKTVFRPHIDNITLIGRIRKDARLFSIPGKDGSGKGRKRYYGDALPTPEQMRQDDLIPWQQVVGYAAGSMHTFDIKVIDDLRWRGSSDKDMRLIIIRPLSYRLSKSSRLLYRQPAYLLTDGPEIPIEKMLQAYLWRWGIEVNVHDEKSVLGVGQAQVRDKNAVEALPALQVAAYSFLLLAAARYGCSATDLPRPKWNPAKPSDRCTTQQMIGLFRTQMWGIAIRANKTQFVDASTSYTNSTKFDYSLSAAICHARK
jgi:hypothetical protein